MILIQSDTKTDKTKVQRDTRKCINKIHSVTKRDMT